MFFKGNTKACIRLERDRKTSLMINMCHLAASVLSRTLLCKGHFPTLLDYLLLHNSGAVSVRGRVPRGQQKKPNTTTVTADKE